MPTIREILRRLRRGFPLRPGGVLVVAVCGLAVFFYGRERGDLLLYIIGGTGLGLCLVTTLLVAAVALLVHRRLGDESTAPLRLCCDVAADAGSFFRLPQIPLVDVQWSWQTPAAPVMLERYRGYVSERVTPRRRGRFYQLVRRVAVADMFGIARIIFLYRTTRELRFTPATGAFASLETITGLAGGDFLAHPEGEPLGDTMDMRRYGDGDPIKFILWKVFAKSRAVMVRSPERAFSPAQQVVAYLVTAPDDQAAAGAARVVIEQGAMGADWLLGADGSQDTAAGHEAGLELIVNSAATPPEQQGLGLANFISDTAGRSRRLLVFVPPSPGPWLARVATAISRCSAEVDVVIGTDGVARPQNLGGWRSWVVAPEPDNGSPATARDRLRQVVATLGKAGARVMLADRSTGEIFSRAHLDRMVSS